MTKDKLTEDTYHTLKNGKIDIGVLQKGKPIKKRRLVKWIDGIRFRDNRNYMVKAYIRDNHYMTSPLWRSLFTEYWEVGKDISKDRYFEFKDFRGNIYIDFIYIDGKRYTLILMKDFWKSTM